MPYDYHNIPQDYQRRFSDWSMHSGRFLCYLCPYLFINACIRLEKSLGWSNDYIVPIDIRCRDIKSVLQWTYQKHMIHIVIILNGTSETSYNTYSIVQLDKVSHVMYKNIEVGALWMSCSHHHCFQTYKHTCKFVLLIIHSCHISCLHLFLFSIT